MRVNKYSFPIWYFVTSLEHFGQLVAGIVLLPSPVRLVSRRLRQPEQHVSEGRLRPRRRGQGDPHIYTGGDWQFIFRDILFLISFLLIQRGDVENVLRDPPLLPPMTLKLLPICMRVILCVVAYQVSGQRSIFILPLAPTYSLDAHFVLICEFSKSVQN